MPKFERRLGWSALQVYDLMLQAVGRTANGMTIHPHPTLGESIGMAAEVTHGSCMDTAAAQLHRSDLVSLTG